MVPRNRVRISCTVDKNLWESIGEIADMYGMAKSTLCAYWIAQGYAATREAFKAIRELPVEYVKNLDSSSKDN